MRGRFLKTRLWASPLLLTALAASLTALSASPAAHNSAHPSPANGELPPTGSFAAAGRDDKLTASPSQAESVERVINHTRALQPVSVTEAGMSGSGRREFKIVVKNVCDQGVVEYIFLRNDDSTLRTSGATSGWSLPPGDTDAVTVILDEGEVLTLSAVLLEDGTGEGDFQQLARIKDYRLGVHEQYKRAEPILRQVVSDPVVVKAPATLESLQNQLSALPVPRVGRDVSPDRAAGLHDAKRFIELQLGPAQEGEGGDEPQPEAAHSKAGGLLKQIEKALARFQRSDAAPEPHPERR